ncbi:class I SAM-dependent methyltransferase [Candidatus Pacearchaeota archaeon]|nr:class I SAM-dependent methyltransferase [Candidatus Pacearchaeota archaeon]
MVEKLNLGCGTDIRPGYINLDSYKFKGVDKVWDINKTPLPFKDNTFKEVIISHVLEHVNDVVKTMEEVWRISKPGAVIDIGVPYFSSLNMVKDPTHKHFFAAATFDFFERGKLGNYFDKSSKINFKIIKRTIIYSNNSFLKIFNPLVNLSQKFYERFFAYIFPSQVLEVKLKVVK